jgi:rhodanese-related sulfurtransferase
VKILNLALHLDPAPRSGKLPRRKDRTSLDVYNGVIVQKALERAKKASLLAAAVVVAAGCRGRGERLPAITVGQLATELKSANPPLLYDANGDRTRREYGVIPGAVLLPSSRDYSLRLLPESKAARLVFYCASTWCGAAETAAQRAERAGYQLVSVLPDGIKGWTEAGMPTQKPN